MTDRIQAPSRSAFSSDPLPEWLSRIVDLYNSHACNQFVIAGNIQDLFFVSDTSRLATLAELIQESIVPRFNVVLSYDIGNGVRVERGGEIFGKWNEKPEVTSKNPRTAIELITYYLRYAANIAQLGQPRIKVAVILKDAHLVASEAPGSLDTHALAFLIREWSRDRLLSSYDIVSFVLTESFSELHPLLRQNGQAARILVSLPDASQIMNLLQRSIKEYPVAMKSLAGELPHASRKLSGSTLQSIQDLIRLKEHRNEPLKEEDLARTKSALIEQDCPGLLEILSPKLTLENLHGQEALKKHFRENIELWRQNRFDLIPMGYLISGPVGTGKTYLVKCLAGEADVPVVILKNFRDKWYGSTESNLEKIFRTVRAIGQCYVFIDEADQMLGRRDSASGEPGVSGRIYSMLAQEMSNNENRGKIVWILATSRPDLVEVDLKRPGRIDWKIPLFPAATPEEGFKLLQSICRRHEIELGEDAFSVLEKELPDLLTPGEAEALVMEFKREIAVHNSDPLQVIKKRLEKYSPPVPREVLLAQIDLAIRDCSKLEYIPPRFRAERVAK